MTDLQTLLTRCRELGATFTPGPDGKLKVRAPAPLPEELQEELRRRKGEVLTLLCQQQPACRSFYRQAAEAIQEECFLIDPVWLVTHHCELWERLRALDEELTCLEQQGAEEQTYRHSVQLLCNAVRQARALYDQEEGKQCAELVRQ